jgi:hypothetical protein
MDNTIYAKQQVGGIENTDTKHVADLKDAMMDLHGKKVIKEVNTKYIEEIDSEGVRRIRVVTETTTWFGDNVLARHNPTKSTSVEYL